MSPRKKAATCTVHARVVAARLPDRNVLTIVPFLQ
jgi:hypothetical protein